MRGGWGEARAWEGNGKAEAKIVVWRHVWRGAAGAGEGKRFAAEAH